MLREHNFTILIIDDLPMNVFLLEEILVRKGGYRVVSSNDGPHGRELATTERPDLILLDIMMPGEDGFETCRKLQQDPHTVDIPIIFISGLADTASKVKGLSIGGWDYITKPFQGAEVLARVKNYLRLRQAYLQVIAEQTKRLQQVKDAQQAILVNPEELPAAGFAVHYTPVQEAGGDFYDVFALGKDLFGYFVADISGHDLGASFATSALKALIRQNSSPLHGVEETMRIINTILLSLFSGGQHLTAVYVTLNKRTMSLSISSAAHLPLLYLPRTGEPRWIEAAGDVMGAFEDAIFVKQELKVASGDRFFLLTDGLIESFTGKTLSRTAGLDTFEKTAQETREQPLQEATEEIVKRFFSHDRQPEDDILVLGVDI